MPFPPMPLQHPRGHSNDANDVDMNANNESEPEDGSDPDSHAMPPPKCATQPKQSSKKPLKKGTGRSSDNPVPPAGSLPHSSGSGPQSQQSVSNLGAL